ncbi:reverse transcriptase domain-containing protein [Azospirillum formosense]|nr:reverse transcriptase domain-containing protein [Azospirillum formosense]MBY3755754.1 RNA-directed DNA polymerase (reverse transcriptase) protein [Azospirillum formosense]
MPKPYQIFCKKFKKSNLQYLFEERISKTRTVGRDGVRTSQFADRAIDEVDLISRKVANGTYKFTRYREKLISKGPLKAPRMLSIPTVRDRLTLRALCDFLAEVYPEAVTRKPHDYIKSIKEQLVASDQNAAFLRIDVRDYYPSVNRDLLIKDISKKVRKAEAISLIEKALTTPTFRPGEGGVPQGLSISNILANIYLLEFDSVIRKNHKYYRYVDDILIICKSFSHAQDVFNEVKWRLKNERHLECHELGDGSKSCISNIQRGVDYLGFHLSSSIISVRESSLRKMISGIISLFSRFRTGAGDAKYDAKFTWLLNLRITGCRFEGKNYGWMFFFLQSEDTRQLARLDRLVRNKIIDSGRGNLLGKQKNLYKNISRTTLQWQDYKIRPKF